MCGKKARFSSCCFVVWGVTFALLLIKGDSANAIDRDYYTSGLQGFSATAIRISAIPTGKAGTGFYFTLLSDSSTSVFITNAHVIKGARQIRLEIQAFKNHKFQKLLIQELNLYSASGESLFVAGGTLDLVAIPFPPPKVAKRDSISIMGVIESACVSPQDLYAGESALFFGYPLGISINSGQPLLRQAVIAGIDTLSSTIYLDAQSFPGSSGSPVFVDEKTVLGSTPTFIGVMRAYVPYEKFLYNPETERPEMKQTENSGISLILPAWSVTELAKQAIERSKEQKK